MVGCPSTSPPQYTNHCSADTNDRQTVPSWCGSQLPEGDARDYREAACRAFGGESNGQYEWGNENKGGDGSCKYSVGSNDVCTGGVGVAGATVSCQRQKFFGNPLTCCNLDYDSSPSDARCFSDSNRRFTCDPTYRGPTKAGCRDLYLDYCVEGRNAGTNINDPTSYTSKWANSNSACTVALAQNTPATVTGGRAYAQKLMEALFKRYFVTDGYKISNPNEAGYNVFQDRILALAQAYPDAAAPYLKESLCTGYSRTDLSGSTTKTSFCGCYLQPANYQTSQNLSVSVPCDPLCSFATAVRLVDAATGSPTPCGQTVCVIDNVSINLVNSRGGNITFQQLCGNCPNGSCSCSIIDVDINSENSQIGDINLNQNCGAAQNCYSTDPNTGLLIPYNCQATPEQQNEEIENGRRENQNNQQNETNKRALRITVIVIGVVLVILLLLGLVILLRVK